MPNDYRYEVVIYWSKPETAFIAEVPELLGCAANGATYQKTNAAVQIVVKEWIETAQEIGRPIPKASGHLHYT